MKRKKFFLIGIIAVITAFCGWMLMPGPVQVAAVSVQKGTISQGVRDSGIVQPVKSWDVFADQNGRIINIPVVIGQKISRDQVMMTLSDTDLSLTITQREADLSQAEAEKAGARAAAAKLESELTKAKTDLTRAQDLLSQGAITRSEYEDTLLQVRTSEKTLKEQEAAISSAGSLAAGLRETLAELRQKEKRLKVQSPGTGMILQLPVSEGEVVVPGQILATVSGSDALEVKADILSDDLADIKTGQPVMVKAPVLEGKILPGRVRKIYPQAEEKQSALGITQRRVPVIISLIDSGNLKPGFEVEVTITTQTKKGVLLLPRESVRTKPDGGREVFLLSGGQVVLRSVTTGLDDGSLVEIRSGLAAGDLVAKDSGLDLKSGQKIEAVK